MTTEEMRNVIETTRDVPAVIRELLLELLVRSEALSARVSELERGGAVGENPDIEI